MYDGDQLKRLGIDPKKITWDNLTTANKKHVGWELGRYGIPREKWLKEPWDFTKFDRMQIQKMRVECPYTGRKPREMQSELSDARPSEPKPLTGTDVMAAILAAQSFKNFFK